MSKLTRKKIEGIAKPGKHIEGMGLLTRVARELLEARSEIETLRTELKQAESERDGLREVLRQVAYELDSFPVNGLLKDIKRELTQPSPTCKTCEETREYKSRRDIVCMGCKLEAFCEITLVFENEKVTSAAVTKVPDGWKYKSYGDAGGMAPYCPDCSTKCKDQD
jgi:hypothetical protein